MVFNKICSIIAEQLGIDETIITMDTNLTKDLEADSLDAVEIIMSIEEEFGIEIEDDAASAFKSIGDIVAYVENAL
ncbi:MAG: acyl carrier protein [Firmicutes bacterium]|nr:acyl carrier protein [Bacillota bacterium]